MTTILNAPAPASTTALEAQIDALEDAYQLPSAFVPNRVARRSSRSVHAVDLVAPWSLGSRIVVGAFLVLATAVVVMVLLETMGIAA